MVGGRVTEQTSARATRPGGSRHVDDGPTTAPSTGHRSDAPICFGRYLDPLLLGEGGMGHVYEAVDPELDRRVAIKMLRARRRTGRTAEARLRREAQVMGALSHPNVVQVFDVGLNEHGLWIAMELVDGVTLRRWLDQPRTAAEIIRVFVGAARGLAAAHDVGVVHRDFKLSNVMVDATGVARVLDFGVSTAALPSSAGGSTAATWEEEPLTGEGAGRVGTPLYMSPEQYRCGEVDARSDQFSFCVALHVALRGQYPEAVQEQSRSWNSSRLAGRPENVPPGVARVLHRGLSARPHDRYDNMRQLAAALSASLTPRRKLPAFLAAGGIMLAGAMALATTDAAPQRCEAGAEAIDELVGSSLDAKMADALSHAKASERFAWDLARSKLDGYTGAWRAEFVAACEAGADDPELMDLRLACLERRRQELAGAVDGLVTRHAAPSDALPAVLALSSPRACTAERVLAETPPPQDAAKAMAVDAVRRQLAHVDGQIDAGAYEAALRRGEALRARAEVIAYEPLEAEIEGVLARAYKGLGRSQDAADALERAFMISQAAGHDRQALKSAIDLAWVVGDLLGDPEGAAPWIREAEALLERRGRPPEQVAALEYNVGLLRLKEGDYAAGIERLNAAVKTLERVDPDSERIANAHNNLAIMYHRQGNIEHARDSFEAAVASFALRYGETHVTVGQSLANLGASQRRLGETEAAQANLERSLEILAATVGSEHPANYGPLTNLANLHSGAQRIPEAIALLERARGLLENAEGARTESMLVDVLGSLGHALQSAGRHEEAAAEYRRAMELQEPIYGREHPRYLHAAAGYAGALLDAGEQDQALALLLEQDKVLGRVEIDPIIASDVRRLLARALWPSAPARARLAAELALRDARSGADTQHRVPELRAWLDEHAAP